MESFIKKLDNRKLWGQVGSDDDWKQAREWAEENSGDILEFSWDVGFKLDYDGEVLKILSRFYPPHKKHVDYIERTGKKYTGQMTVYFLDKELHEVEIHANSLDELAEKAKAKADELISLIDKAVSSIQF